MIGQTTLRQSIGTILAIVVGAVGLLLLSALFGNAQAQASGRNDYKDHDKKHYSYKNHDDHDYDKKKHNRSYKVKYDKHDRKDRCDNDHKYSSHYKWVDNNWKWDDNDCDCDCDNDHDYKVRISYSNYNWNDWDDDCDDHGKKHSYHQRWD